MEALPNFSRAASAVPENVLRWNLTDRVEFGGFTGNYYLMSFDGVVVQVFNGPVPGSLVRAGFETLFLLSSINISI